MRLFATDGRALAARAPTLRRFTPDVRMIQGFFTFRRRELEERPLDRFEGSAFEDGRVVLRFSSEDGASGTLTIAVDAAAGVLTSVRFEAEWAGSDSREVSYALPFACDADGSFVGFGAQYDQTDQRGEAFALWVGSRAPAMGSSRATSTPRTTRCRGGSTGVGTVC